MQYGHVLMSRQSVYHQSIDMLASNGVLRQNILVDCMADKTSDRPAFDQLPGKLKLGDALTICSLNQLEIDLSAISKAWRQIICTQKAEICILDMESSIRILNSEMHSTIINVFPQLLNYLYKAKGHYRKQRQAEGSSQALARGKILAPDLKNGLLEIEPCMRHGNRIRLPRARLRGS